MTAASERIPFAEASYTAALGSNPEFAPAAYRLGYPRWSRRRRSTIIIPPSDRLETLKVQEIPSGYDPARYETERLMLPARDGKQVPVSIVYRKGFASDGPGKLFLYAYGAYGYRHPAELLDQPRSACSTAASPTPSPISAAATISATTGILDGKLDKRTNTFNDFVDAAQRPDRRRAIRAPGRIAIQGGSAGGELMGAVVNSDPRAVGRGGRRRAVRRRAQHHARRHACR